MLKKILVSLEVGAAVLASYAPLLPPLVAAVTRR